MFSLWDVVGVSCIGATATLSYRANRSAPLAVALTTAGTAVFVYFRRKRGVVETHPEVMTFNHSMTHIRQILDTLIDGEWPVLNNSIVSSLALLSVLDKHRLRTYRGGIEVRLNRKRSLVDLELEDWTMVKEGKRLVRFAAAAYGYLNLTAAGMYSGRMYFDSKFIVSKFLDIDYESIIWNSHGGNIGVPKHYIVVKDQVATICIRGTFNLNDVLIDITADSAEFLYGHAHRGMAIAAKALYKSTLEILSESKDLPNNYRLDVCGHSLGAGVAILYTMLAYEDGRNVRCFAYAPPPVFTSIDDIPMGLQERIAVFVVQDDVVPRASLASVARLLHRVRQIDTFQISWFRKWWTVLKDKHHALRRLLTEQSIEPNISSTNVTDHSEISIPGKIFWILKTEDSDWRARRASPDEFRHILVTSSCFQSHVFPSYVNALEALNMEMSEI